MSMTSTYSHTRRECCCHCRQCFPYGLIIIIVIIRVRSYTMFARLNKYTHTHTLDVSIYRHRVIIITCVLERARSLFCPAKNLIFSKSGTVTMYQCRFSEVGAFVWMFFNLQCIKMELRERNIDRHLANNQRRQSQQQKSARKFPS